MGSTHADTAADGERQPAAPPERGASRYAPVFVLAPARSNSSVVSAMIGMHPQLYGFPELALFRSEQVEGLLVNPPGFRGLPAMKRSSGLLRAIAQLHDGRQDADTIEAARRWLHDRDDWQVEWVLDHLLELVGPRVGVEKSPEDSSRRDYLDRLVRCYPHARFIHLTRHPVSTVESMHAAWSPLRLWEVPDQLLHTVLTGFWLFHHHRLVSFTAALPPRQRLRLRSEDVLNDPRPALRRICHWLGVDDGEESLEAMLHPEASPYARIGPPGALGGNDPGFLRSPEPRRAALPAGVELPRSWGLDPWLQVAVLQLAEQLGYPAQPASARNASVARQPGPCEDGALPVPDAPGRKAASATVPEISDHGRRRPRPGGRR
jgi:hypothetical protein